MAFLAYQQIAVNTSVVKSNADLTVPQGTNYALIQADIAGALRYTLNGTGAGNTPTNTAGMILAANTTTTIDSAAVQNIKFIANAAVNTSLNIHYFQ